MCNATFSKKKKLSELDSRIKQLPIFLWLVDVLQKHCCFHCFHPWRKKYESRESKQERETWGQALKESLGESRVKTGKKERQREREMIVNEREGRRVTGAGWALASQTRTMIPVQEQIGQFFMACPLAASSISAFYIYFQISDCSKHSSRLKRQLRNSCLDPARVRTQPTLCQTSSLEEMRMLLSGSA